MNCPTCQMDVMQAVGEMVFWCQNCGTVNDKDNDLGFDNVIVPWDAVAKYLQ